MHCIVCILNVNFLSLLSAGHYNQCTFIKRKAQEQPSICKYFKSTAESAESREIDSDIDVSDQEYPE